MNGVALDRLAQCLRTHRLDAALISNPSTITWLTGYAPPIQTGPSPFEGGPAMGWWQDGEFTLVASNLESSAAKSCGARVVEYVGYTIEEPLAGSENQAQAIGSLLKAGAGKRSRVAVELNHLPARVLARVSECLPLSGLNSLDAELELLRAVKTPEEIDKLRSAVRVCDLAQGYMRSHLNVGLSEIELWGDIKKHLETVLGTRLPVLVDLVGGARTAEIGGLPGPYRLRESDPVILDFVPRWDGYWGDNTDTRFVGRPGPELEKIRRAVREALRRGVEAVRPGKAAKDVDRLMRASISDAGYPVYPHHSGHGVGTSYHEEPRLVPYNELRLEPGMVIALEPGVYLPDVGGVRLEDVVQVTSDGCEVMTRHLLES